VKDHEKRELVSELVGIASIAHGTEQLRDRIAYALSGVFSAIDGVTGRADKAESELARLREQKPVRWHVRGNYFHDGDAAILFASRNPMCGAKVEQLYAAPAPAVSDKRVDELAMLIRRLVRRLNQELPHNDIGEAAMDYLARNGISGEILRGWAAPAVPEEWRKVMAELADDLAIEIDQSYPPERRAYPSEQRKYEGEMAPVYRARTLLQSATQSGSDPVAHHPV